MLGRLLGELAKLETGGAFDLSVVVADNDRECSAREVVEAFARRAPFEVVYCAEPEQNIALARNRAIAHAKGDFIAFIDDDEFPGPDWLARMLAACEEHGSAGVLGPVRPHFDDEPAAWLVRGRFCERPEHPTGMRMDWNGCRTGNVLFRRSILPEGEPPFDRAFGTGGEDKDFFMRMNGRGHFFTWCNEAPVYETVPPSRQRASYMFKRALLRGRNILKHPEGRLRVIATSLVALPAYTAVLPVVALFGKHKAVHFGIRWCDHCGRLLALVGLNRINERDM
jgi:glycosyltransferase involved in cell wall biosynthesis